MQECFATMFELCRKSSHPDTPHSCHRVVAQEASALLVQRCSALLLEYVDDLKLSGRCPLPRRQQAQLLWVLEQLESLELTSDVLPLPPQFGGALGGAGGIKQAHLLKLLPALCECVGVMDSAIQQRIVAIMHKVSQQLGLEAAPAAT